VCWALSNTALAQRITAWQRVRLSVSRFQHEAALTDLRAALPEDVAIHRQVRHDVLARLDKTYQAFFRRVQRGGRAGFPREQARARWHSFTDTEFANGATLQTGFLVLSTIGHDRSRSVKIGRIAVRWSRRLEGAPRWSRFQERRMGGPSASPAPTRQSSRSRPPAGLTPEAREPSQGGSAASEGAADRAAPASGL
jgi:hypothetical protein